MLGEERVGTIRSGLRRAPVSRASNPTKAPAREHDPAPNGARKLLTLYAAVEQGFASALPALVRDELEGYIACGVLSRGFAVFACSSCQERKLVAFSCGGRGFCPSCMGRRMAQGAANWVDHILPQEVPLRQFVLTLPFELRAALAYDSQLLGGVGRIFVDTVLGWSRRRLAERGIAGGHSGSVTVIQRLQSDLRLNPHYHAILLDGVFAPGQQGALDFHQLPSLRVRQAWIAASELVPGGIHWYAANAKFKAERRPLRLSPGP